MVIDRNILGVLTAEETNVVCKSNEQEDGVYNCDPVYSFLGDIGNHHQNDETDKQHGGADFAADLRAVQHLPLSEMDISGNKLKYFLAEHQNHQSN